MNLLFLLLLACGEEDSGADTAEDTSEETDTEVYIRYH